jgi:hypothetical protein
MKRKNYLVWFFGAGFFLMASLFLLSNKEATIEAEAVEESIDNPGQQTYMLSQVNSVPLPDRVEFCGEIIELNRLDLRERFDREINSFTYLHSTTLLYLKRANRYFPIIEPILKKNNIPDDFKYLCVIESNLDIRALSTARAAGLWQFMEAAGRQYGLEITSEIDERYHIEKATEAACRYLRDAYSRYGNWVNAAASYNAGMGRISTALSSQRVDCALDLLVVSETSRYVFRILAIKQLFENPYLYGYILKEEDLYPSIEMQRITVSQTIGDLVAFSQQHGINYMLLKDYNTWLRDTKLTVRAGKTYEIAIPRQEDLYFGSNTPKVHDERWLRKR